MDRFLVVCAVLVMTLRSGEGFKYEAPDPCSWTLENNDTSRVAVTCRVRTLQGGELGARSTPSGALAALQPEGTSKLRLECSEALFFESFLEVGVLGRLAQLEDLEIEHCKLARLHEGVFRGLGGLKKLSVRTHVSLWSSARQLEVSAASFEGLRELQSLDLAENNLGPSLPAGTFCALAGLNVLNLSMNALQQMDPALLGASLNDELEGTRPQSPSPSCEVDVMTLDVSHNNLTDLPSLLSSPRRRRLQQLLVQNNQLTALRASSLAGLAALRVVNASANRLVDLPAVPLRETCRELRELHLRENQ